MPGSLTSLAMAEHTTTEKPQNIMAFDFSRERDARPQSYYDDIKERLAAERDLRLSYRPPGAVQYTSEIGTYATDPYIDEVIEREPIVDEVEVLFIGGGVWALLTSGPPPEGGGASVR